MLALLVAILVAVILQTVFLAALVHVLWRQAAREGARVAAEDETARAAAAAREAEQAEQSQRRAPRHHINPAQRRHEGWVTSCSCGWWSQPHGEVSDALDQAEAHLMAMPQRRVG